MNTLTTPAAPKPQQPIQLPAVQLGRFIAVPLSAGRGYRHWLVIHRDTWHHGNMQVMAKTAVDAVDAFTRHVGQQVERLAGRAPHEGR
jgi:hypothetical protein